MVNPGISNQSHPRRQQHSRRFMVHALGLMSSLVFGCQATSNAKATGGVTVDTQAGCPAGVAAVLGDSSYASTQIALLSLEGEVQSSSFISTASRQTDGLSFALSGDVVLPASPPASGRIVILDRFGTNVITWVDTATAKVDAQLPVGTGFESNPQDYLEIANSRALVSRWGVNSNPGAQQFDTGSDVLVVDDPTTGSQSASNGGTNSRPAIESNIAIPGKDNLPPRPSNITQIGNFAAVVLQRYSEDFSTVGDAQIVRIDLASLQIVQTLSLSGVSNCGRLMPMPGTSRYIMACTGPLNANGNTSDLSRSAFVQLEVDNQGEIAEKSRLAAADIAQEPLQNDVTFANDHVVLVTTQTAFGGTTNNRLLAVNLNDKSVHQLAEARPGADGKGKGAVYGSAVCSPGCSAVCLLADSDEGVVRRFDVSKEPAVELESVNVTPNVPLYPRQLAPYGGTP